MRMIASVFLMLLCVSTGRAQDNVLRLQKLEIRDPGINNTVAFTMLIPEGWQAAGGVEWRHHQSNLAVVHMTVTSPDGSLALEAFPIVPLTWIEGGPFQFQPGANYLGNIVYPPVTDAARYVAEGILPYYRQHVQPQLIDRKALPDVAATIAQAAAEPGAQKQVVAERIRLGYQLNGQNVEEDFYVALVYATTPMLPGTTFWQAHQQYAFRAPAGELDKHAPLLQAMIASVRVQPEWAAGYAYVVQLRNQNQMQAIRDAGELSRRISQNNDEIMRMNRETYENQQRSSDRINQQFSEAIRGVETYQDPYAGRSVELPSGYNDVWVSESGGYILSNDANFNPNEQGAGNWQRAQVATP